MVDTETNALPKPDARLRAFERFVGAWEMQGRTFDSDHDNVKARATFEYLPGGFFVAQRFTADFAGLPIESLEIIGYDPATGTFPSTVYSSLAGQPVAYRWEIDGDDVTISTDVLGATFHGRWSGTAFAGGWRPNPGREGPGNVPYDISGRRATSDS